MANLSTKVLPSFGPGTYTRSLFVATASQTTFAVTYTAGLVDVYLNGVKLVNSTDYTATNGTSVVFTAGAVLNDNVEVIAWDRFNIADAASAGQGALADSAVQPNDSPSFGNITVSGTVDGVDLAANIPTSLGTAGQVLTVNSGATAGEWSNPTSSVAVYVDNSGGASVNATTDVVLNIANAEIEDTNNYSNTAGVVTVTEAGNYIVKGTVGVTGTTSTYRWVGELSIVKNGSTQVARIQGGYVRADTGADETYISIDRTLALAASDTIELKCKRISTTSGNATTVASISTLQLQKL